MNKQNSFEHDAFTVSTNDGESYFIIGKRNIGNVQLVSVQEVNDLIDVLLSLTDQPTRDELAQTIEEFTEVADAQSERIAALEGELSEAKGERAQKSIQLRQTLDELAKVKKELREEQSARLRVDLDLSRALGYIDRVVEDEPPVKDGQTVVMNRHCGDVGETFVQGPQRRGPLVGRGFNDEPWR